MPVSSSAPSPSLSSSSSSASSGADPEPSPRLRVAALLAVAAAAGVGVWTLSTAGAGPFGDPRGALARAVLSGSAVGWSLVLAALTGLAAVLLTGFGSRSRPVLAVIAVAEVGWLGLGLQSVSTVTLAGYLLAMALPLGLVWLAFQAARRYSRLRLPLVGLVGLAAFWGWSTGVLRPVALATLVGQLGGGFARAGAQLGATVLLVGAAAAWLLVLLWLGRSSDRGAAAAAWVRRHRRTFTLLAAAGPLPYALVRATWLTPWPQIAPTEGGLPPEMRLWGLLLGGGAALGVVLTLGLVRPWGRRFPRWTPWWAGRAVPVRAAVVPGGLVAGVVTASALPMMRGFLLPEPGTVFDGTRLEQLLSLVIFPFWLWGPALALAVWGYALDRVERDRTVSDAALT